MTPRTRTESHPTPLRNPQRAMGAFLGAAVLSVLLLAPSLGAGPFVPRLAVDNPTPFDITIELAAGDRSGWTPVGTVRRDSGDVVEEIADPGATWVFRFSYAGMEGGELTVPRSDLRAADWQLVIPMEVGETLTAAGFVPSAS
jgi:hypothetical protein